MYFTKWEKIWRGGVASSPVLATGTALSHTLREFSGCRSNDRNIKPSFSSLSLTGPSFPPISLYKLFFTCLFCHCRSPPSPHPSQRYCVGLHDNSGWVVPFSLTGHYQKTFGPTPFSFWCMVSSDQLIVYPKVHRGFLREGDPSDTTPCL